jgi:hypothetical protein
MGMISEPVPKVLSVPAKAGSEHSPQMTSAHKPWEINFFIFFIFFIVASS